MNVISKGRRLATVVLTGMVWLSAFSASASAADGRVHGTVRFEKILCRDPERRAGGLLLDRPTLRPVVGAKVDLIDGDNKVLASGVTDAAGGYSLAWSSPLPPLARVRVLAEADNATIVDHNNPDMTYSLSSESWNLTEGDVGKDILATDKTRASGPFNILAVIRIGNDLVRSAEPGVAFPKIKVLWTTRPRPGTSYFVPGKNLAYILGDRSKDSDEFDDFIILHEYGHFLAHTFSRDNSIGGAHGRGDRLDPRVAWSEGWASFFACAALNDPLYVDTGINRFDGSGVLLQADVDEDRPNGDRAGYWSEHSVSSTLWDIFDKRPGKNHLGRDFAEIWQVLRSQAWQERAPYRNLIDFCDILIEMRPELGSSVADVLAARGIRYAPGKTPSLEAPYIQELRSGVTLEGELNSVEKLGGRHNTIDAAAVFTFTLTERTSVKLHLDILASKDSKHADLDLWLVAADGRAIKVSDRTNGVGGTEEIEIELPAGRYFVEVRSWARLTSGALAGNTGSYRVRADF